MWAPLVVVVPVTVITKVGAPAARPETVNTGSEASPGLPTAPGPAVSTEVAAPPSMDTVAIPQMLHLRPIQLTAVPVKVKVAVAPAMSELPAAPPLKVATSAPRRTHAPAGLALTAGLSSSMRVTAPPLETLTVTPAEVVRLPAASRATALKVCEPLATAVVLKEAEYGAALSSVRRLQ